MDSWEGKGPIEAHVLGLWMPWCPVGPSPAVCFLCSSKRSAELMEELAESLSSRARVSN